MTAAYGKFLPQAFLDLPRHGTLNIHPSLLPKYRGASPVQRTLQAGDQGEDTNCRQIHMGIDQSLLEDSRA